MLPLVLLDIGILLILIISPLELVLVVFLEIAIHPLIVLSLIFIKPPIILCKISKALLFPILPFQILLSVFSQFFLVKMKLTFAKNWSCPFFRIAENVPGPTHPFKLFLWIGGHVRMQLFCQNLVVLFYCTNWVRLTRFQQFIQVLKRVELQSAEISNLFFHFFIIFK
jgi:hypothetical protein